MSQYWPLAAVLAPFLIAIGFGVRGALGRRRIEPRWRADTDASEPNDPDRPNL